tara:strand:+ start:155 stop:571 length:417 start_codon:yes stop_codon:yes gene_type:complete
MTLSRKDLAAKLDPIKTIEVRGLGPINLKRLDLPAKVRIIAVHEGLEKNDKGELVEADALNFGVELLAMSLAEDDGQLMFDVADYVDCPDPYQARLADARREVLDQLGVDQLNVLADAAIEHNGLAETDDEIEAEKKS